VATPILLAALYHVLNNTDRRGARPLVVILGGSLVWLLSALTATLAPTFEVALFANRFQYFGITALVTGFAVFALIYVGREEYVNKYSVGLLAIEPIAVLALVWTGHPLWTEGAVGQGTQYTVDGAQVTCDATICFLGSGPAFIGHTLYSYVLLLVGSALVVLQALRSSTIPRGQAASMLVATIVPTVGNVVSIFVLPESVPDLTPVTFGVMGIALVVGLYRYSLVETDALTGAVEIHENEDGAVLVEDAVVDLNIGAATVLGLDADNAIRTPVDEAFDEHEKLRTAHADDPATADGLTVSAPFTGETHRVNVTRVAPDGAHREGWLYEFQSRE